MFPQVLLHFEREHLSFTADFEIDFERIVDFWQSSICRVKLDIDDRADDLNDSSFMIHVWFVSVKKVGYLTSEHSDGNWILQN